ncbi:Ribosomal subunit 39S [Microdochium nivale]|nr:Ribosomal subunit 39S [Microdochium nivale]
MRHIARLRQAASHLASHAPASRSVPTGSSLVAAVCAHRFLRRTVSCRNDAQIASSRFLSTTSNRRDDSTLPKSLVPEDEAVSESNVVTYTDNAHYRPPPVVSQADDPDSISDPTYVPATKGDDLQTVGGLTGWWEDSANYRESFQGFKPRRKISEPAALRIVLRRAVVEALVLRQAGAESLLTGSWPVGGQQELRRVLSITLATDGSLDGDLQAVVADLQAADNSPAVPTSARLLSRTLIEADDSAWEALTLPDVALKFAVSKRLFQLTGQRISDFQLGSITDVRSMLTAVQKAPKARTLAEEIKTRRPELFSVPNVTFAAKRVTRGDKDKSVGRFKVIEEELRKRDLPLKGHDFAEKNKELQRHHGGA